MNSIPVKAAAINAAVPIKAIVVLDRRASSWFSEKLIDDWSVDYQLMDVDEFLLDIEAFDRALRIRLGKGELDVVLLDAALPTAFLMKTALRVRDKAPGLPVLLLPQLDCQSTNFQSSAVSAVRAEAQAVANTLVAATRYANNRQRLQSKLLQMALKDDLTGLHNRRGFIALAKQHLRLARSMKRSLLLLFADMDGLKQINDQFGHHAGDQALAQAAAGLKRTFRKSDVIARLGGDEFVVLVMEEDARNPEIICQRLQDNLVKQGANEHRYKLSLSVGVARFDPATATSLQELMKQADAALYKQKRRRKQNATALQSAPQVSETARPEIDTTRLSKRSIDKKSSRGKAGDRWLSIPQLELNARIVPP